MAEIQSNMLDRKIILSQVKPDQWWAQELLAIWGGQYPDDTKRAACIAYNLVCAVASSREDDPLAGAEARLQEIKTRRLEIDALQAERKRAYICEGRGTSAAERATTEAELANLALEAHLLANAAERAKMERRKRINATMLPTLRKMLDDRGMGSLVMEAEAASIAAIARANDEFLESIHG